MARLDKFLCDAGKGTRKEVKAAIKSGRVKVGGEVVKQADFKLSEEAEVYFDGALVSFEEFTYIVMNKPAGVVCAAKDLRDKTVFDILPSELMRKGLFTVGRLDKDTVGLLLITNDGEFSHKVLSPKSHVEKEYYIEGKGKLSEGAEELFKRGLSFGRLKLKPAKLTILEQTEDGVKAKLVISEGKFHQVKRMMYEAGIEVTYLKREKFGGFSLPGELKEGEARLMTAEEREEVLGA